MKWTRQVDPLTGIHYLESQINNDMEEQQYFFIKVTDDYWPAKNKLQEILKQKMREIDRTLAFNMDDAREVVRKAFDQAHQQCKTKCAPINWYEHSYVKDVLHIQFQNVVHLAVYKVSNVYFEG
jgi:hypothetical protein